MKRRKKVTSPVGHDRWLVSYADFITLLFAFFVVLYSAAEIDKKKVSQVAASIQVAFQQMGAFPPSSPIPLQQEPTAPPQNPLPATPLPLASPMNPDLSGLRQELEKALAKEIARGEVAIHAQNDGLVVSLREMGFFDSGSVGIKSRSQPAVDRLALLLAEHKFSIRIEGHTDDVPIHNSQFSSNWELSTSRATEMVRLLVTKYQIPPQQLSAAGYGEYHPVASNDTEEGRAQNRRVDVVILGRPR